MTAQTPAREDVEFPVLLSMGPLGANARELFLELDAKLRRVGAEYDAERLQTADARARTTAFPTLEQLAAPDLLVESLSARQRGTARAFTGVRNAVALLPLLVTWLFLAWSALEYQRELAADPLRVNTPFLLLWERRFDGAAIPSFSTTAVITGVLLVLVLGLTLLAHRLETGALRAESQGVALVDRAMNALQAAVEHGMPTVPVSAQDWALTAQRILADTQRAIDSAVKQTRDLAAANQKITESAQQTLQTLSADAKAFVKDLSDDMRSALVQIRQESEQNLARISKDAVEILAEALASNRTLIAGELNPLVTDFRKTLEEFVQHHETYRDSARLLAKSSSSMDDSARMLAASAKSYTEIATSIDDHLRVLEGTQKEFVDRVTSSADSMRSASDTMLAVSTALSGDVKKQIEQLAKNVVKSSADVASINTSLVASSSALERVTTTLDGKVVTSLDGLVGAMDTAAKELRAERRTTRRWWQWRR